MQVNVKVPKQHEDNIDAFERKLLEYFKDLMDILVIGKTPRTLFNHMHAAYLYLSALNVKNLDQRNLTLFANPGNKRYGVTIGTVETLDHVHEAVPISLGKVDEFIKKKEITMVIHFLGSKNTWT